MIDIKKLSLQHFGAKINKKNENILPDAKKSYSFVKRKAINNK